MQCPICCETKPLLYPISACSHRFCFDCCVTHITTKSDMFVEVLCPENGCKKEFVKDPAIWNVLPGKVVENVRKRERYGYLSANPHLKQCTQPNCKGIVNTKQPKRTCDKCATAYCPKCMKPFHNGPCLITNEDREMRQLNYQKCPQCSAWIEKKEGCNYIDCKCGTNFCYSCGVHFKDDPCRLQEIWALENELRTQFLQLKFKPQQQKSKCVVKILKLPLKLLFLCLLTILLSIVTYIVLIIIIALILIMSPFVIIGLACTAEQKWITLLILLFLPIVTACAIVVVLLVFLLYPLLRKTAHHGVYDGFDLVAAKVAGAYVALVLCIM